ncbi:MAG TPA: ATP-binding protein [Anaerolineae bacterium]|nr:ATP-binding protein [Anaerolineae bacterium]
MSNNLFLNWGLLAVSLFNTIILLWLGLTVLLNSDRRAWGIWLGGLGLLLGAAFFVSHSVILSYGPILYLDLERRFWLYVAVIPAIVLPFSWYIMILWYAGYWNEEETDLSTRHHYWLRLTVAIFSAGLFALLTLASTIPWFDPLRFVLQFNVFNIPFVAIGYFWYIVLCTTLSVDVLRRPGPSHRVMGRLARRRARPWLTAASIFLLLVSLLVGLGLMLLILITPSDNAETVYNLTPEAFFVAAIFDLTISTLIGVAVLLLGRAIVAYEVFTGKTLPRRGLIRHWYVTIIFAFIYSTLIGGTLTSDVQPIYSLLLTALLIAILYALFSWRSFVDRERFMDNLRPFLMSQRVYEQLLVPAATPTEMDLVTPFRALCHDVLGAQLGYLTAVGPLAPLVEKPLSYPHGIIQQLPPLSPIATQFRTPETNIISVPPETYNGAHWAVPLWSERGLIGLFFLGDKWDGAVYTQEEIDIARLTGERIIDTQASAEMARRLMLLQRERLAASQIADQRTRRTLHDDILPLVHTAMLALSGLDKAAPAIDLLSDAHHQISDLLRAMPTTSLPQIDRLGLIGALRKIVSNELEHAFDGVHWELSANVESHYHELPSLTAEVIFYAAREALRNAARHGRDETSKQPLLITIHGTPQQLIIEDNGQGIHPHTSRQEPKEPIKHGGSGQGLSLHSTMMAVVGGTLAIESIPQQYTRVILTLPESF